jgi:hypothetical protein
MDPRSSADGFGRDADRHAVFHDGLTALDGTQRDFVPGGYRLNRGDHFAAASAHKGNRSWRGVLKYDGDVVARMKHKASRLQWFIQCSIGNTHGDDYSKRNGGSSP